MYYSVVCISLENKQSSKANIKHIEDVLVYYQFNTCSNCITTFCHDLSYFRSSKLISCICDLVPVDPVGTDIGNYSSPSDSMGAELSQSSGIFATFIMIKLVYTSYGGPDLFQGAASDHMAQSTEQSYS